MSLKFGSEVNILSLGPNWSYIGGFSAGNVSVSINNSMDTYTCMTKGSN